MRGELIVLLMYTMSIGNIAYRYGYYRADAIGQEITRESVNRSDKLSFAEGCEAGIRYNCYVNDCAITPIEELVNYCYDNAKTYSKH